MSYHARGPQRQDYGYYDEVVRVVLRKLRAASITLAGVTVDNPYDYLMGEHSSVTLKDPKSVSWYAYPRQIVPETAPHSMTALVKAVIERVRPGGATSPMPSPRPSAALPSSSRRSAAVRQRIREASPSSHGSSGHAERE